MLFLIFSFGSFISWHKLAPVAHPYPCPVPVQSFQVIHQWNCRAPCEASISENTNKFKARYSSLFQIQGRQVFATIVATHVDHVMNFIAYMYERDCTFFNCEVLSVSFEFLHKCS